MSATSHTSGTLTGVTTAAGEEAWRLLQELLMNGEMQTRMRTACAAIGGPPSIVKTLFQLAPGEPVAMRDLAAQYGSGVALAARLGPHRRPPEGRQIQDRAADADDSGHQKRVVGLERERQVEGAVERPPARAQRAQSDAQDGQRADVLPAFCR